MTILSHALDLSRVALEAVNPTRAVTEALRELSLPPAPTLLLAAGKAAPAMALAAYPFVAPDLWRALVITARGHTAGHAFPADWVVCETGHPLPDADGLRAVELVERALDSAPVDAQMLFLLSGGASALLPAPAAGLSLADVQRTTDALLRCGATIHELNAVRKHLERLKGGALARRWAPRPITALLLSDVLDEDPAVIGSGPVTPDPTTCADAWSILARYDLLEQLPDAVLRHLQAASWETPKPGDACFERVNVRIIAANRHALMAVQQRAAALGYTPLLLGPYLQGEAREVGRVVAGLARSIRQWTWPVAPPACLIWGGETTVTVRGTGSGGRNQELALAAALALEGVPDVGLLAFSTDGRDGPTDAAGAFVDGFTAARLRAAGVDARQALINNDSYHALDKVGALVRTGPTGTNVNDVLVMLVK